MITPRLTQHHAFILFGCITLFVSLFLVSYCARANEYRWLFDNDSEYTFDNTSIQVGNNSASLRTINQADTSNDVVGFGGGVHMNTAWDPVYGRLAKSTSDTTTSTFTSRVFDAFGIQTWNQLDYKASRPYNTDLPDNGGAEHGYTAGNATMTGNALLYHLNEAANSATWSDTSGNGGNATCVGSACPVAINTSYFSTAPTFNGTSTFLNAGSPASLNDLSALSVETWFKPNRSSDSNFYSPLVEKWSSGATMTTSSFDIFNVTQSLTSTLQSFSGAVFDGRYVYYLPFSDKSGGTTNYSSNFLRYDPRLAFNDPASYTYYDLRQVNAESASFSAAGFDGRYIYVVSQYNGTRYGGIITRYDTTASFNNAASYQTFNSTQINDHSRGMGSVVFDGRYMYFISGYAGASRGGFVSEVTRYDTTRSFSDPASYTAFEITSIDSNAKGIFNAFFDGRYVYFTPNSTYSSKLFRYDTLTDFTDPASYQSFNLALVTTTLKDLIGGAFDGRYIYFAPASNATTSVSLRLDTAGNFTDQNSYTAFDITQADSRAGQYSGAFFDGRYLYYIPVINLSGHSGLLTRYDTQASYTQTSSYSVFDVASIDSLAKGYDGGVFDGRYFYLAHNDTNHDGYMVRYDITRGDSSFALRYGNFTTGKVASLPGLTALLHTSDGQYSVSEWSETTADQWHHVLLTYDGTTLALYIDGVLKKTTPASGTVTNSATALTLGTFNQGLGAKLAGSLDETAIYSRALSSNEALERYLRGANRIRFQVRTCTLADCSDGTSIGFDGTNSTYFATGTRSAMPTTSIALADLTDQRYFQYKIYFESDTSTYTPSLYAVTLGPDHYRTNTSSVSNRIAPRYDIINSFSATVNTGTVAFRVSPNNNDWLYWNGAEWTASHSDHETNTAPQIDSHLSAYNQLYPRSEFYFQAFLLSPIRTTPSTLSSVRLIFEPTGSSWSGGGGGGGGLAPQSIVSAPSTILPSNTSTPLLILQPQPITQNNIQTPSAQKTNTVSRTTVNTLIKKTRYGERSLTVKQLQTNLQKLGFFPSTQAPTGYYGPITRKSITDFRNNEQKCLARKSTAEITHYCAVIQRY